METRDAKKYVWRWKASNGMLSSKVILALFGVKWKQKVTLMELNLPIHKRIALLNECIRICNMMSNGQNSVVITEDVVIRAYCRLVGDPFSAKRTTVDIQKSTEGFPSALTNAIKHFGYIDEWAKMVQYDPVTSLNCTETTRKPISKSNPPDVKTRVFVYNNGNEKKAFGL
jgi:hypothetical protein